MTGCWLAQAHQLWSADTQLDSLYSQFPKQESEASSTLLGYNFTMINSSSPIRGVVEVVGVGVVNGDGGM